MNNYYVYILTCSDDTLYVGSTNNLEKRLHKHNNLKSGAHYTKIRRPVVLSYSETVANYSEARAREGELKKLSRKQKLNLIKSSKNT
jgi:putative endonuclease